MPLYKNHAPKTSDTVIPIARLCRSSHVSAASRGLIACCGLGAYLAVLFLEGKQDVHASIASFVGSNRYILDLLGEGVLASVPEYGRRFMLQTAVLSKMTGPLCDAVVGGEGSGALLDRLARSNLFVVPLDDRGVWYRYHHLFSELLLYELKGSRPDILPVLHGRAHGSTRRGFSRVPYGTRKPPGITRRPGPSSRATGCGRLCM